MRVLYREPIRPSLLRMHIARTPFGRQLEGDIRCSCGSELAPSPVRYTRVVEQLLFLSSLSTQILPLVRVNTTPRAS